MISGGEAQSARRIAGMAPLRMRPYNHSVMEAEELDQRVAQRTRELAAANEDLKSELSQRRRAESLFFAEKRSFEMIAPGASLTEIFQEVCRAIDAQAPGTITSVLLMCPD